MSHSNILTLMTNQGQIYHMRDTLYYHSMKIKELIDQTPTSSSYFIPLTFRQLYFTLLFLDTLQTPNTNEEWLDLIDGVNYFKINPVYYSLLVEMAKKYLDIHKIKHRDRINLDDVAEYIRGRCHCRKDSQDSSDDCQIV